MTSFRYTRTHLLTLLALVSLLALSVQALRVSGSGEQTLPVLGEIEAFSLRSQDGVLFDRADLLGTVHVVNFLFTSCDAMCPLLVRQMQDVERNTRDMTNDVRFLSISVDPETDTPAVLKAYVTKRAIDSSRWTFLTGELRAVERAVVGAFQSPMGKRNLAAQGAAQNLFEITHGEHFVIVDRQARIRAFHHARNEADVREIVTMVRELVDEPARRGELAYDH